MIGLKPCGLVLLLGIVGCASAPTREETTGGISDEEDNLTTFDCFEGDWIVDQKSEEHVDLNGEMSIRRVSGSQYEVSNGTNGLQHIESNQYYRPSATSKKLVLSGHVDLHTDCKHEVTLVEDTCGVPVPGVRQRKLRITYTNSDTRVDQCVRQRQGPIHGGQAHTHGK